MGATISAKLEEALGIDPMTVMAGSLRLSYNGNDESIHVSYERLILPDDDSFSELTELIKTNFEVKKGGK